MKRERTFIYHLIAILVVILWGTTFISSKVLLQQGLDAHEFFFVRFLIAYACIWTISPHKLFADTFRDECLLLLLGVTGGTLYFITENIALKYTLVNNVSFIVCSSPLLATLIALCIYRGMKATPMLIGGSIVALIGVGLVIFNGHFVLNLNPIGDTLALTASLSWAVYSLLLKKLSDRYRSVFITRKVFFYGLLTVLPLFVVRPWNFPVSGFFRPQVLFNFLFLGLIASFICFAVWSYIIKKLGALRATNYIYLNPISTMIASAVFLSEPMTVISFLGCFLILSGVFLAGKNVSDGIKNRTVEVKNTSVEIKDSAV